MTNSDELDFSGRLTANSSFGQSAQPKHPLSNTAPSLQIRRESGISSLSQKAPMTPMAPGSQPNDYSNDASTTQTTSDKKTDQSTGPQLHTQSPVTGSGPRVDYPDLTSYPDRISQEEQLPDTQQGEFPFPSAFMYGLTLVRLPLLSEQSYERKSNTQSSATRHCSKTVRTASGYQISLE